MTVKTGKKLEGYTPGPWAYHRTHQMSSDTWYVIVDRKGFGPITEVGGHDVNGQIAEAKYLVTDPAIIEANAALIAQAPTLLEQRDKLRVALLAFVTSLADDVDGAALCELRDRAERVLREVGE